MQRRMFSPQIVESEEFLSMPVSSQALYFHLGMHADDDGFVQPKIIMRSIGSNDDDLKVLLVKRFLLSFEGGVVVIKHWLIHNLIQKDRYHATRFQDEKKTLFIKENKAYTDNSESVNKMLTEVRLGKVRLSSDSPSAISPISPFDEKDQEYQAVDEDGNPIQSKAKKTPQNKQYEQALAYMAKVRSKATGEQFGFGGSRLGHYKALKEINKLMPNERAYEIWEELCESKFWPERGFDLWTIKSQFLKKGK